MERKTLYAIIAAHFATGVGSFGLPITVISKSDSNFDIEIEGQRYSVTGDILSAVGTQQEPAAPVNQVLAGNAEAGFEQPKAGYVAPGISVPAAPAEVTFEVSKEDEQARIDALIDHYDADDIEASDEAPTDTTGEKIFLVTKDEEVIASGTLTELETQAGITATSPGLEKTGQSQVAKSPVAVSGSLEDGPSGNDPQNVAANTAPAVGGDDLNSTNQADAERKTLELDNGGQF